jgi:hypothetical protein
MQSMGDQLLRQQQTFQQMVQEQMVLRSAAEHPALLRLPAAAAGGPRGHGAGLPAGLRAVDGVGPKAAANVPADVLTVDGAGANTTAGFPADSPEAAERAHGPVQATLCVTFCEIICSPPGG